MADYELILKKISQFWEWNPDDPKNTYDESGPDTLCPTVNIELDKVKSIIRDDLESDPIAKKLMKVSGEDWHTTVDNMPSGNFILWLDGRINDDQLVNCVERGLTDLKRYHYPTRS